MRRRVTSSTAQATLSSPGRRRSWPYRSTSRGSELTGNPVPLVEDVGIKGSGAVSFALSSTGSLMYATGNGSGSCLVTSSLVWVDRDGSEEPVAAKPRNYAEFSLSPDGTRVAVRVDEKGSQDVWIADLTRATSTRLTFDPTTELSPAWARLGVRLVGEGSDVSDRWGWRKNTPDRDRVLRILRRHQEAHPDQRLVILSGDIHLGLALVMRWNDESDSTVYQFVSSAVSNSLDPLEFVAAKIAAHAMPHLHHDGHDLDLDFLPPQRSEQKNPFSGLNFGIVQVRRYDRHSTVRFRLITHGENEDQGPVVAYDTGEL